MFKWPTTSRWESKSGLLFKYMKEVSSLSQVIFLFPVLLWPEKILPNPIKISYTSYKNFSYSLFSMNLHSVLFNRGFPEGASGIESACQCRRLKRCGFDSRVGKIPWRRAWQPIPVFLPRESHWRAKDHRVTKISAKLLYSWNIGSL